MNKVFKTFVIITSVFCNSGVCISSDAFIDSCEKPLVIIIEKGATLLLRSSLTITKSDMILIEEGGLLEIDPNFPSSNIILKDNAKLIDRNMKITLTALSSEDDWKNWSKFYNYIKNSIDNKKTKGQN